MVRTPANAFYDRLNEVLDKHHFDRQVEHQCRRYSRGHWGGRASRPGVYFLMLLIGYFEGLDSERGIAWRRDNGQKYEDYLKELAAAASMENHPRSCRTHH